MKKHTSILNIICTVFLGLFFVGSLLCLISILIYHSGNVPTEHPAGFYIQNTNVKIFFGIDVFDLLILLAVFIVSIFTCIKKKTQIFTRYLLPISFGLAVYLCIYFVFASNNYFGSDLFYGTPDTEIEFIQAEFGFWVNQIFALISLIAFIFIIVAIIISIVQAHKHKKEKEQYINSNNYKKVFITSGSILIGCVLVALLRPLSYVFSSYFYNYGIHNYMALYFQLLTSSWFLYLIFIVVGVNLIIDTVYYHKHIKTS